MEYSKYTAHQNILNQLEIYGGIKNLLDFTPDSNSIARPYDPFDQNVVFGNNGQVIPTAENPYALTFDPSYVYASNQGIRGFIGIRYTKNKNVKNSKLYLIFLIVGILFPLTGFSQIVSQSFEQLDVLQKLKAVLLWSLFIQTGVNIAKL